MAIETIREIIPGAGALRGSYSSIHMGQLSSGVRSWTLGSWRRKSLGIIFGRGEERLWAIASS